MMGIKWVNLSTANRNNFPKKILEMLLSWLMQTCYKILKIVAKILKVTVIVPALTKIDNQLLQLFQVCLQIIVLIIAT